eukprot:g12384.t2
MGPSASAHVRGCVLYFFRFVAYGCVSPFMSLIWRSKGLSEHQIGLLGAIQPVVSFFWKPVACAFADRHNIQQQTVYVALFLHAVTQPSVLLARSFLAVAAVEISISVSKSPVSSLVDSAVRHAFGGDGIFGLAGELSETNLTRALCAHRECQADSEVDAAKAAAEVKKLLTMGSESTALDGVHGAWSRLETYFDNPRQWKGDPGHVQNVIRGAALAWRVVERADHHHKAASRTAPGGKGGQQPPAQKEQRSSDSKVKSRVCGGFVRLSYDCPFKGKEGSTPRKQQPGGSGCDAGTPSGRASGQRSRRHGAPQPKGTPAARGGGPAQPPAAGGKPVGGRAAVPADEGTSGEAAEPGVVPPAPVPVGGAASTGGPSGVGAKAASWRSVVSGVQSGFSSNGVVEGLTATRRLVNLSVPGPANPTVCPAPSVLDSGAGVGTIPESIVGQLQVANPDVQIVHAMDPVPALRAADGRDLRVTQKTCTMPKAEIAVSFEVVSNDVLFGEEQECVVEDITGASKQGGKLLSPYSVVALEQDVKDETNGAVAKLCKFGFQRLWGAVGFGVASLVAGYVSDLNGGSYAGVMLVFVVNNLVALVASTGVPIGHVNNADYNDNDHKDGEGARVGATGNALTPVDRNMDDARVRGGHQEHEEESSSPRATISNTTTSTAAAAADDHLDRYNDEDDNEAQVNDSDALLESRPGDNNTVGDGKREQGAEGARENAGVAMAIRIMLGTDESASFFMAVVLSGIGSGVIDTFLFIRLEELGGSHVLCGLARLIMCGGEVLLFHLSGPLIRRVGVRRVIALAQLALITRFVYYSVLREPWRVLPAEVLHGLTFAAMWAATTNYAHQISPAHLRTTIQGMVSGVYGGLGQGLGSMLGGLLYAGLGARRCFAVSSSLPSLSLLLLALPMLPRWCKSHSMGGRPRTAGPATRRRHGGDDGRMYELVGKEPLRNEYQNNKSDHSSSSGGGSLSDDHNLGEQPGERVPV